MIAYSLNIYLYVIFRDGYLLEKANLDKIRHIPTTIVQGRYDVVCPPISAYLLHKVVIIYIMYCTGGTLVHSSLQPFTNCLFSFWPTLVAVMRDTAYTFLHCLRI